MGRHVAPYPSVLPRAEPICAEPGCEPLVQDRGVLLHGVDDVQDRGQHLVVNIDQPQSFLRDVGAGRRHRRHRVALVQRLLMSEVVLRHHAGSAPVRVVDVPLLDDRKVDGGGHGFDAGEREGPGRVDGAYPGMSIWATEHLAVKQARQLDIGGVPGAARHLVQAVLPDRPGAQDARRAFSRTSGIGCDRHADPPYAFDPPMDRRPTNRGIVPRSARARLSSTIDGRPVTRRPRPSPNPRPPP